MRTLLKYLISFLMILVNIESWGIELPKDAFVFPAIPKNLSELQVPDPINIDIEIADSLLFQLVNPYPIQRQYDVNGVCHIDGKVYMFISETDGYYAKIYMADLSADTMFPPILTIFDADGFYPKLWFEIVDREIILYDINENEYDENGDLSQPLTVKLDIYDLYTLRYEGTLGCDNATTAKDFQEMWDRIYKDITPNGRVPKFTIPDDEIEIWNQIIDY